MQTTTNGNRNRRTPDYKLLAAVAIMFNPLLGCVALVTNDLAKRRLCNGDLLSANYFYFVTIAFSVFSIGSTVTAICMLSMHSMLQQPQHQKHQQYSVLKRLTEYWCIAEIMKLNISMDDGVSVDDFCDLKNKTIWFSKIDKARHQISQKLFNRYGIP